MIGHIQNTRPDWCARRVRVTFTVVADKSGTESKTFDAIDVLGPLEHWTYAIKLPNVAGRVFLLPEVSFEWERCPP